MLSRHAGVVLVIAGRGNILQFELLVLYPFCLISPSLPITVQTGEGINGRIEAEKPDNRAVSELGCFLERFLGYSLASVLRGASVLF